MSRLPKGEKWNWRAHLTVEEARFIREADAGAKQVAKAQSDWNKRFGVERPKIVNRALQRAKAAGTRS